MQDTHSCFLYPIPQSQCVVVTTLLASTLYSGRLSMWNATRLEVPISSAGQALLLLGSPRYWVLRGFATLEAFLNHGLPTVLGAFRRTFSADTLVFLLLTVLVVSIGFSSVRHLLQACLGPEVSAKLQPSHRAEAAALLVAVVFSLLFDLHVVSVANCHFLGSGCSPVALPPTSAPTAAGEDWWPGEADQDWDAPTPVEAQWVLVATLGVFLSAFVGLFTAMVVPSQFLLQLSSSISRAVLSFIGEQLPFLKIEAMDSPMDFSSWQVLAMRLGASVLSSSLFGLLFFLELSGRKVLALVASIMLFCTLLVGVLVRQLRRKHLPEVREPLTFAEAVVTCGIGPHLFSFVAFLVRCFHGTLLWCLSCFPGLWLSREQDPIPPNGVLVASALGRGRFLSPPPFRTNGVEVVHNAMASFFNAVNRPSSLTATALPPSVLGGTPVVSPAVWARGKPSLSSSCADDPMWDQVLTSAAFGISGVSMALLALLPDASPHVFFPTLLVCFAFLPCVIAIGGLRTVALLFLRKCGSTLSRNLLRLVQRHQLGVSAPTASTPWLDILLSHSLSSLGPMTASVLTAILCVCLAQDRLVRFVLVSISDALPGLEAWGWALDIAIIVGCLACISISALSLSLYLMLAVDAVAVGRSLTVVQFTPLVCPSPEVLDHFNVANRVETFLQLFSKEPDVVLDNLFDVGSAVEEWVLRMPSADFAIGVSIGLPPGAAGDRALGLLGDLGIGLCSVDLDVFQATAAAPDGEWVSALALSNSFTGTGPCLSLRCAPDGSRAVQFVLRLKIQDRPLRIVVGDLVKGVVGSVAKWISESIPGLSGSPETPQQRLDALITRLRSLPGIRVRVSTDLRGLGLAFASLRDSVVLELPAGAVRSSQPYVPIQYDPSVVELVLNLLRSYMERWTKKRLTEEDLKAELDAARGLYLEQFRQLRSDYLGDAEPSSDTAFLVGLFSAFEGSHTWSVKFMLSLVPVLLRDLSQGDPVSLFTAFRVANQAFFFYRLDSELTTLFCRDDTSARAALSVPMNLDAVKAKFPKWYRVVDQSLESQPALRTSMGRYWPSWSTYNPATGMADKKQAVRRCATARELHAKLKAVLGLYTASVVQQCLRVLTQRWGTQAVEQLLDSLPEAPHDFPLRNGVRDMAQMALGQNAAGEHLSAALDSLNLPRLVPGLVVATALSLSEVFTQPSVHPGAGSLLSADLERLVRMEARAPAGAASAGAASADAATPGAATPHAATPEAATPHAATPGAATPEAATHHAATHHAATPEAATPHAATPGAATPHAATPEAATPEAATPEAATPDVLAPSRATKRSMPPGFLAEIRGRGPVEAVTVAEAATRPAAKPTKTYLSKGFVVTPSDKPKLPSSIAAGPPADLVKRHILSVLSFFDWLPADGSGVSPDARSVAAVLRAGSQLKSLLEPVVKDRTPALGRIKAGLEQFMLHLFVEHPAGAVLRSPDVIPGPQSAESFRAEVLEALSSTLAEEDASSGQAFHSRRAVMEAEFMKLHSPAASDAWNVVTEDHGPEWRTHLLEPRRVPFATSWDKLCGWSADWDLLGLSWAGTLRSWMQEAVSEEMREDAAVWVHRAFAAQVVFQLLHSLSEEHFDLSKALQDCALVPAPLACELPKLPAASVIADLWSSSRDALAAKWGTVRDVILDAASRESKIASKHKGRSDLVDHMLSLRSARWLKETRTAVRSLERGADAAHRAVYASLATFKTHLARFARLSVVLSDGQWIHAAPGAFVPATIPPRPATDIPSRIFTLARLAIAQRMNPQGERLACASFVDATELPPEPAVVTLSEAEVAAAADWVGRAAGAGVVASAFGWSPVEHLNGLLNTQVDVLGRACIAAAGSVLHCREQLRNQCALDPSFAAWFPTTSLLAPLNVKDTSPWFWRLASDALEGVEGGMTAGAERVLGAAKAKAAAHPEQHPWGVLLRAFDSEEWSEPGDAYRWDAVLDIARSAAEMQTAALSLAQSVDTLSERAGALAELAVGLQATKSDLVNLALEVDDVSSDDWQRAVGAVATCFLGLDLEFSDKLAGLFGLEGPFAGPLEAPVCGVSLERAAELVGPALEHRPTLLQFLPSLFADTVRDGGELIASGSPAEWLRWRVLSALSALPRPRVEAAVQQAMRALRPDTTSWSCLVPPHGFASADEGDGRVLVLWTESRPIYRDAVSCWVSAHADRLSPVVVAP
jgi:hypothetical protein